ncbi:hypothetical protein ACHAQJ_009877 [Trichoderma viride]
MSPDTQGPRPLSGFSNTFGSQRAISDSRSRENKRPANDAGPTLKRRRTVDRSEERSPVAQRDRVEVSNPTTPGTSDSTRLTSLKASLSLDPEPTTNKHPGTAPNRQRNPDNPKQHLPSPPPKVIADHKLDDSLKLLYLFSEKMEFFQTRGKAVKLLKKAEASQEQNHYRPSGYISAPDVLAMDRKAFQEDIQRAEKHIAEFHDKMPPALRSLLQGILENGDIRATPSETSERPALSEARLDAIQDTIKKEIEAPLKKELAESQQSMQDAFESQMSKLKESLGLQYTKLIECYRERLTHEGEARVESLKEALTQEREERGKSLRASLVQENEKRLAEISHSLDCKYTKQIAKLENDLTEESKKNARQIAELKNDLAEKSKKNAKQIAELENDLAEESKKNATLSKDVADLKTKLDKTVSEQKRMSESLIDKLLLSQQLQQLSDSQDEKLGELKAYMNELGNNTYLVQKLQQVEQFSNSQSERLSKLKARLNQAGDNAPKIEELAGQIHSLSLLIEEKVQLLSDCQDEKLSEFEASLSRLGDKTYLAQQLQQLSDSQDEKLSQLEARLNQAGGNAPKNEELAGQIHSLSLLIEEKVQQLSDSQDEKVGELEASLSRLEDKTYLAQQLQQLSDSQDEKLSKLEARLNKAEDNAPRIEDLEEQVRSYSNLIKREIQQQHEFTMRLDTFETTMSGIPAEELGNISTEVAGIKERVQNLTLSHESTPVSVDLILEVIRPELAKNINTTKDMFKKVQAGLDPLLLDERLARELLVEQCAEYAGQLSDIQKEITAISTEVSGLKEKMNSQGRIYGNELGRLGEMINSRLNSAIVEYRGNFEGMSLGLQSLNEWQNNFNTTGLYKGILSYINSTLPDGVAKQLRGLRQHIDANETRILACEISINSQRRRLPSGNGHQMGA